MAFKFVFLACILSFANGSFIHGPVPHHYGSSTSQHTSQELRYPTTSTISSTQSASSQSENIIREHGGNGQSHPASNPQKTSSSYALSNQGKSDIRVSNPGTYSTSSYNGAGSQTDRSHKQQVNYASTPNYNSNNNNNNVYEHSVSSSLAYQQSTPVYGHSNDNAGTVYGHHVIPVYQYVSSAFGLPHSTNYAHNGNAYTQAGTSHSGSGTGIIEVPYSPAVAVSHMSYSSPVGISYSW